MFVLLKALMKPDVSSQINLNVLW